MRAGSRPTARGAAMRRAGGDRVRQYLPGG